MPQVPHNNLPASVGQDRTWSSPDKLSRKVRELAHRSRAALKAAGQPHVQALKSTESGREAIRYLRNQVARLQQTIHCQRLWVLIPWVDALRRRLEERLSSQERQEQNQIADT
jgi:hypothetical protein